MYRPPPQEPRARCVFDYALGSRLAELSRYPDAGVLLICDAVTTVEALAPLRMAYPRLRFAAAIANPQPLPAPTAETPRLCAWDAPDDWQQVDVTDRWARIRFAMQTAQHLRTPGSLIMPANDAVWGRGLIVHLLRHSQQHARRGLPAAVSPVTPYQHSRVPGADIPQPIIDALNAAFNRDSHLARRLRAGGYQAFWGKMGLIPYALCDIILPELALFVWEDDLEIDRALHAAGCGVYGWWVRAARRYRQALPVFDADDLRRVIERTLHYSLPIPGAHLAASSLLLHPLDAWARWRRRIDRRCARALALSESITQACLAEMQARIDRCGCSWVDWGAYRYVARVGDPVVQVWRKRRLMLK